MSTSMKDILISFESIVASNTKKLIPNSQLQFTPNDLYLTLKSTFNVLTIFDKETVDSTIDKGKYNILIASFLTALTFSGLHLKSAYIAEACRAILERSETFNEDDFNFSPDYLNNNLYFCDIVGTGGDGQNTFNVSTSSALVMSGYNKCKVIKHGGKASTSNSGSGDMINKLGINTSKVDKRFILRNKQHLLETDDESNQCNFMFLLAPQFHYAMKLVAHIRSMLKIPTIFNIVGPLLHPMGNMINKRILGVYHESLGMEYCEAAKILFPNCHTLVVNGLVGLDEMSPIGDSLVWEYNPALKTIEKYTISPSDFGLHEHGLDQCASMSPELNAKYLKDHVLNNFTFNVGDNEPIYDYILMNSALMYSLINDDKDYKKAVAEVDKIIKSGKPNEHLNKFIDHINSM
ncbi:related to Anthranilate phosphoribosyltransferase [Hanseniaspora guilliermondii]|uniref:Related to Anthranilate phosphoribosyltransferase n=1 Tax=Hanseniaspora guilliermondii TaxID=56406 RepID=A0A1L0B096_9ASCO|nr:related to Anthranilate phosphoribosyltransferase [Hanseniaspora guilliermondii]